MHRNRKAKIVATLGPASADRQMIERLFLAGADVFRLNFSHGTHADHKQRLDHIREIEREVGRPIGVLLDLQGPKLRLGTFANGAITLANGDKFRLDLDTTKPGDQTRVSMPHPEIFKALRAQSSLLIDDGRVRLLVEKCGDDFAETVVVAGGTISDRKGVNVPDCILQLSALTDKDRADLDYGLSLGVDWVALSFVQRPEDILEIKKMVDGRAKIIAKLEKPSAIASLESIVEVSDAIMVARGDLGVEMPPEEVPAMQKQIIRSCRRAGKPVIVATQMLESMVNAPVPTRAEASDVATAIYDGADAVMLSAESASGKYPVEAVNIMSNIIARTESDPYYREAIDALRPQARATKPDAIGFAVHHIADLLDVPVTVAYTSSGSSALSMARERSKAPCIALTPRLTTARCLALVWGVHAILCHDVADVHEMTGLACETAKEQGFASLGQKIVISAGMPFGTPGSTNLLRIAEIR